MKRILTIAAIAALSTAAHAGDLGKMRGAQSPAIPQAPAEPEYTHYAGPYIALGAGFDANSVSNGVDDISVSGLVATGRVGWDFQQGRFVFGPFADVEWNNADSTGIDGQWSVALGGRAGLVIGQALVYVNGGFEWKHFDISTISTDYDPSGPFVGAGLEASLGEGWTIMPEGRISFTDDKVGSEKIDNQDYSFRVFAKKRF